MTIRFCFSAWVRQQRQWLMLSLSLFVIFLALQLPRFLADVTRNLGALMLIHGKATEQSVVVQTWLAYSYQLSANPHTLRLIGTLYQQEGKFTEAIQAWQQANMTEYAIETFLALLPTAPPNRFDWENQFISLITKRTDWVRLGNIFQKRGNSARAVDAYQQALRSPSGTQEISKADIYYNLGYVYQFQLNDFAKALDAYYAAKQAGKFQDEWREFNTYLQIASLELGKNDRIALASAQMAVWLKPNNDLAHTVLGLAIYAATGDLQAAEREMILAAHLNPKSLWPWLHRAQLYLDAHKYEEAIDAYKQVLILDPNYEFAKKMIEYVQQNFLK